MSPGLLWFTGTNATVCASCWRKKEGLSLCQRCRFCYYCNKDCQISDWRKEHKHECALLAAALEVLAPQINGHRPGDGWTAALHLLYLKTLNRFTVDYNTGNASTAETREIFLNPISECRKAAPTQSAFPLGPVSIAPKYFRDVLTVRAERKEMQDCLHRAAQLAGRNSRKWNCDCLYCTDAFAAEMIPIKCATGSCMEPILSDERALLPCPQCGATNGNRLNEAREHISEGIKGLLDCSTVKELYGGIPDAANRFAVARSLFLKEMQDPQVLVHPSNMIGGSAAFQMMENMMYSEQLPTAFQYATLCCEAVRRYYTDVDPFYGIFLKNYAKCAVAYWKGQLEKGKLTKKALDAEKEIRLKMAKYVELQKQGDAILKKFSAPE